MRQAELRRLCLSVPLGTFIAIFLVMSQLDVSDLTRIAREAVQKLHLPVEIVAAMLAGSDSDRVEILVNVDGCVIDPCLFSVAVFRNSSREDLLDEIGAGLREHLENHRRTHQPIG